MGFTPLQFSKSWLERRDFPTYEPDEEHVRADMQLLHDETRDSFNALVTLLNSSRAAENLPVQSGRLKSSNVQQALEEVLAATEQAAAGTIPNATIGKEKLTPALLDRIYGGKLWVGLDIPGPEQNPAADFPVGQLWLRPGHTVLNLARQDWIPSGCTLKNQEPGWVLTSDGSLTTMSAVQTLDKIGSPGDRILVCLKPGALGSHLSGLTLWLNGLDLPLSAEHTVFETNPDTDGSLELLVTARMPYEEAGQQLVLEHLTVVNLSAVERQAPWAHGKADWPAYVTAQAPFDSLHPGWTLYGQDSPGHWQLLSCQVWPLDRGGTGLTAYKPGQLLYADSQSRLRPLEPPAGKCWLAFDGAPQWISEAQLLQSLRICHVCTGTYVGSGKERTLELPVRPTAIYVYADQGPERGTEVYDWPAMLLQGAQKQEEIYGSTQISPNGAGVGTMSLRGKQLQFSAQDQEGRPMETSLGNRFHTAYSWVAIWEEENHAA